MSAPKKYLLRELSRDTILNSFDFINEKTSKSKFVKLDNGSILFQNVLLQEADKINGNGRIYPFKILKNVVDSYQDKIRIRQAVGALGHPNCIREGAKILTFDGWKDFRDISDNELILTYNTESGNAEYQNITKKIVSFVEDELIHFSSRMIDTVVTKNHRFYLKDRHENGNFYTANELYENRIKYNHFYIPRKINNYKFNESDYFIIPKLESLSPKLSNSLKEKYSLDVSIDMDTWSSFLGLYLAEGHASNTDRNYSVSIFQNESNKSVLIEELIKKMPFDYKKYCKKTKFGKTIITFKIIDKRLNLYLRKLGKAWEKYIPVEMKNVKKEYLLNIINWYHLGDGRQYISPNGFIKKDIFSTSLKLIEDFSEILLKCGLVGNIKTEIRNRKDGYIEGRIIKKENRRTMYFLNLSNTKQNNGLYLTSNRAKIEKIKYSGNVYCVQVPNQTFFCMDNNKIYISGNSAEIDPGKISHHIDKIWWEGKQVRGDVRILSTQTMGREAIGLVESEITLGISSRSVGSVTKKSDHVEVNDDLELICWDLVIEPSTQNAYLNESKLIEITPFSNRNIDLHSRFDALLNIRGK